MLVAAASAQTDAGSDTIRLFAGFQGYCKLGHVCPVRIELGTDVAANAQTVVAQTVDGDGVDVRYVQQLESGGPAELWLPLKVGRRDVSIRIEVLGPADNLLAVGEITADNLTVLDADQPLVLAVGNSLGIEELMRLAADGADSNFSVVTVDQASVLPASPLALESVDLLVVSTQDLALMESLGDKWDVLEQWIATGGGCVLSVAPPLVDHWMGGATDLQSLKALLPGPVTASVTISNPGLLESLIVTTDPLREFMAAQIVAESGNVELTLKDSAGRSTDWWVRHAHGHGYITTVASDLGSQAFADWDDRELLWQRLIEPYLDRSLLEVQTTEKKSADTSYLGYADLVGQLRATMDVFEGVQPVSFSQLAGILVAILLLVGPVDYFLAVVWLRKPQFSWYFSTTVLVVSSGFLIWMAQDVRPSGVLVNSVQIVDVDAENGATKGTLWGHVYSGKARQVNVEAVGTNQGGYALDWQGLPGRGLGALSTQLSTDRGMPGYQIHLGPQQQASIHAVGIPGGGTKCLVGNWFGQTELVNEFDLQEIRGVDQLTGSFTNPFSVDINDSVIFYRNWFYRLNSRIPPGTQVQIASDTIPKDIGRKLNERRSIDGKVSSRKWDPSDRQSIDRLLEIMMFYDAATGRNYTELAHRYQPKLDHSNLLETDRAILVGRLAEPMVQLDVTSDVEQDLSAQQAMQRTWFRLAIPVKQN